MLALITHSPRIVLTDSAEDVMIPTMDEPMTTQRWQKEHGIRLPQEAARQLRAAGYVRKVRAGRAVWLPIGLFSPCAKKTHQKLSDAELLQRVKEFVLAEGGIVTVPQVVRGIGRVWNASIQRRVLCALSSMGCTRHESTGVWSAPSRG